VRGADPLRQKRAHAQRPASRADRRLDPRIWLHQPGADHEEDGIIAGHGRVLAAHSLGLDEVPCIVLAHLTPAQGRAYVLADNKLALNAGWDLEMLSLEIGELGEAGFDLSLTGFDEFELGELFAERTQGRTDPDDAPEPPAHPVAEPGDLWVLGRHRLLCGDSTVATDVARVLGGAAPLLRVDQLDAVVFLEHADVVRDQIEALIELLGQQIGAGDPLVQNDQDLYAQWVGEGFGDDLFDAVLLLSFRQGGFLRSFSRGGTPITGP